jgi:hypothetical protein
MREVKEVALLLHFIHCGKEAPLYILYSISRVTIGGLRTWEVKIKTIIKYTMLLLKFPFSDYLFLNKKDNCKIFKNLEIRLNSFLKYMRGESSQLKPETKFLTDEAGDAQKSTVSQQCLLGAFVRLYQCSAI